MTTTHDEGRVPSGSDEEAGSDGLSPPPRSYDAWFGGGTRLLTTRGAVPIETLGVGDLLLTAAGAPRPVAWIERHTLDLADHPDPPAAWPVRIAAGAFAAGRPARDLWLSRDHRVLAEGVPIAAGLLVNGATVTRQPVRAMAGWRVGLDGCDLLLAEGLAVEGSRPAGAPSVDEADALPLDEAGPAVVAARVALLERARALGYRTSTAHDLHILADGRRVDPIELAPRRYAFATPSDCASLTLASRTFLPRDADPRAADSRELGVLVRRLQVDGDEIDLRKWAAPGWHLVERRPSHVQRWTGGAAVLPARAQVFVVELAGDGRYWDAPDKARTVSLVPTPAP